MTFQYGRKPGTNRRGGGFTTAEIDAVWRKGIIVPGVDPAFRRQDSCGAWMDRNAYGVTKENGTGWEIDHIVPVIRGGGDELSNLQPLQWQNNRHKSDNMPGSGNCLVFAK